jgi:hypothetical protein
MKGVSSWVANTLRAKVTAIVQWIVSLGTGIGRLFSGKPTLNEKPPSGNRALGRLSDREIHKQILLRIMRDLSEEYYGAGWIIGLEHYLWNLALRQNTVEGQMLLYCSEVSGGWWVWDDQVGHLFIPLAVWKTQYREDEVLEPA